MPSDQKMKQKQLPLKFWYIILGFSLITIIIIASLSLPQNNQFRRSADINLAIFKLRLDNIQKDLLKENDDFKVVILGTSITADGIDQDTVLTNKFKNSGKKITVARLFYAAADYHLLNNVTFLDFLKAIKPDILCIEDQLFLMEPKKGLKESKSFIKNIHYNFIYNSNLLKHYIAPNLFPEPGYSIKSDLHLIFNFPRQDEDVIVPAEDSLNYDIELRNIRDFQKTNRFNKTAKALSNQGTEMVLLNLPRPRNIGSQILSLSQLKKRDELISSYKENIGLQYWQFQQELHFIHYRDQVHLNKTGRKIYSEWLFNQINEHPF